MTEPLPGVSARRYTCPRRNSMRWAIAKGESASKRASPRYGIESTLAVSNARSPASIQPEPSVVRSMPASCNDATYLSYGGVRRRSSRKDLIGPQAVATASRSSSSAATWLLLVELDRREQLFEVLLLRRDCFGRPRQLEEHAAPRAFDDRTDQAIAGHRFCASRHRAAHAGIGTGRVDNGNRHTASGTLVDLGHGRLAVGSQHLPLPALDVGLDAAALSGPEIIHDAFGDALIACSQWDRVRGRAHRSRSFGLPRWRRGPSDTRRRFSKHARGDREHNDGRTKKVTHIH